MSPIFEQKHFRGPKLCNILQREMDTTLRDCVQCNGSNNLLRPTLTAQSMVLNRPKILGTKEIPLVVALILAPQQ